MSLGTSLLLEQQITLKHACKLVRSHLSRRLSRRVPPCRQFDAPQSSTARKRPSPHTLGRLLLLLAAVRVTNARTCRSCSDIHDSRALSYSSHYQSHSPVCSSDRTPQRQQGTFLQGSALVHELLESKTIRQGTPSRCKTVRVERMRSRSLRPCSTLRKVGTSASVLSPDLGSIQGPSGPSA